MSPSRGLNGRPRTSSPRPETVLRAGAAIQTRRDSCRFSAGFLLSLPACHGLWPGVSVRPFRAGPPWGGSCIPLFRILLSMRKARQGEHEGKDEQDAGKDLRDPHVMESCSLCRISLSGPVSLAPGFPWLQPTPSTCPPRVPTPAHGLVDVTRDENVAARVCARVSSEGKSCCSAWSTWNREHSLLCTGAGRAWRIPVCTNETLLSLLLLDNLLVCNQRAPRHR